MPIRQQWWPPWSLIGWNFFDLSSATSERNLMECRCSIEFWPHWISTRGVLIQRAVLRIQRIFHVEFRPPPPPPRDRGVIVLRPLRRIKFRPPLNCDPGSWFHVELWPQVLIPCWMLTPSHDSTLNYDPGLGSQFNVELWPGVMIQRGMLTRCHNSTLNCDPGSWFHVEMWSRVMIPRWNSIPGHDSTLKSYPGSWFHIEI